MSLRKLRFSVFVIKTYSGTGKRDFNLGLCFCFFPFLFTAAGAYQRPDISHDNFFENGGSRNPPSRYPSDLKFFCQRFGQRLEDLQSFKSLSQF